MSFNKKICGFVISTVMIAGVGIGQASATSDDSAEFTSINEASKAMVVISNDAVIDQVPDESILEVASVIDTDEYAKVSVKENTEVSSRVYIPEEEEEETSVADEANETEKSTEAKSSAPTVVAKDKREDIITSTSNEDDVTSSTSTEEDEEEWDFEENDTDEAEEYVDKNTYKLLENEEEDSEDEDIDIDVDTEEDTEEVELVKFENSPMAEHLTKSAGVFNGPSGKETYYNLNMSTVVSVMRANGYSEEDYPYWVREDGVKMLGYYVMVAADFNTRPRGTIIETSLGTAIVCDTGGFAYSNPTQIDIAVTW